MLERYEPLIIMFMLMILVVSLPLYGEVPDDDKCNSNTTNVSDNDDSSYSTERMVDSTQTHEDNERSKEDSGTQMFLASEHTANPLSLFAHLFLKLYAKYITTQDNHECQFKPSCSAYSQEAFSLYDPVQATLMTSDRLLRCNPTAHLHYPKDREGYLIDQMEEHALW